ncbi:ribonuclease HI [Breznakiellaceae bacterium SP9]
MQIKIYTDGGCSGNPGPGGWGFVILKIGNPQDEIIAEKWGADKHTTNNRMELLAIIASLQHLTDIIEPSGPLTTPDKVSIYTDSQYVQRGMTEWIHSWKKKNWITASRTPVKNKELWQQLDEYAGRFPVSWNWVKGHAGNTYNERCDSMTQMAIASLSK